MGGAEMEMIRLDSLEDYHSLPVNKWNIRQPSLKEERQTIFQRGNLDLVIVPGVAFTPEGNRLGHGKGYYDKFLSQCHRQLPKPPVTIGLAFTQQIVHHIPVNENDVPMNLIIHEQS